MLHPLMTASKETVTGHITIYKIARCHYVIETNATYPKQAQMEYQDYSRREALKKFKEQFNIP